MKWNRYWIVKNITDEDIPLTIRLWSGAEVEDVFHAKETVVISNQDAIHTILQADPWGDSLRVTEKVEEVESIEWKKEGF